ncbi:MAG: hypothetical protein ACTTH8_08205 [Treponema sp.]
MSGSTGIRPLDKALSGLEQTINEWELEAEKPVYISLKEPSLNDLYKEKGEVYKILRCWRSGASALGKKQAAAECDRVIAFFERICGK